MYMRNVGKFGIMLFHETIFFTPGYNFVITGTRQC